MSAKCPVCRRLTDPAHRPFCSPRCADIDLGRWLTEQYSVSADEADEDDRAPGG